jgi:hypothetical protein
MKYLTFILGAGASVAYGLPTGDELVQRVATHMLRSKDDSEKRLGSKLELYAPLSIDSYLMKHYSQKGRENALHSYKAHIAFEIMQSLQNAWLGNKNSTEENDRKSSKFGLRNPQNWLRFIIPELLDLYENYPESECPIKFIIFNYDLSLEFYLNRVIREYQAAQDEKAFQDGFLRWVSDAIVHIYGQVGFYPWQKDYNSNSLEIQNSMNFWTYTLNRAWAEKRSLPLEQLQTGAYELQKHIRVIGEPARANDAHVTLAKDWIRKSYSLVFTGYGFNEDNNTLLELSETSKSVEGVIFGFWDMSINKQEDAKTIFKDALYSSADDKPYSSDTIVKKVQRQVVDFTPNNRVNYPWIRCCEARTYQLLKDELTLSKLYQL